MTGPAAHVGKSLTLHKLEIIDLERVIKLEAESYPPDEAASALDLEFRVMAASELCYVAFREGRPDFIGFVVGTAAPHSTQSMTAEMMKNHDAHGTVLCIHSIVIDHAERGKGYGKAMVAAYLRKVRDTTRIRRVLLLSKPYLVPFYQSLSFVTLGQSNISHGKESWIEMALDLS